MFEIHKIISELSIASFCDDIKISDDSSIEFKSRYAFHENQRKETYSIIKTGNDFILTDKGSTLAILDDIFELETPDVIKYIDAILLQYNIRKIDSELHYTLFPSINISSQILRYLQGINFLFAMKIFYT